MSIMRCEKHGHWDSDFSAGCPLCGLMGPQKWWLVERGGGKELLLYLEKSHALYWTDDINNARRFATAEAAKEAADYVRMVNGCKSRAVEHMFNCGTTDPQQSEQNAGPKAGTIGHVGGKNIGAALTTAMLAQQTMKRATYIGPDCGWNVAAGETALIRESDKPGVVLAQFDAHHLQRGGKDLAFGWHEFPAKDFKVDEATDHGQ